MPVVYEHCTLVALAVKHTQLADHEHAPAHTRVYLPLALGHVPHAPRLLYALVLAWMDVQAVRVPFRLHVLRQTPGIIGPETVKHPAIERMDREDDTGLFGEPTVVLRYVFATAGSERSAFGRDRWVYPGIV